MGKSHGLSGEKFIIDETSTVHRAFLKVCVPKHPKKAPSSLVGMTPSGICFCIASGCGQWHLATWRLISSGLHLFLVHQFWYLVAQESSTRISRFFVRSNLSMKVATNFHVSMFWSILSTMFSGNLSKLCLHPTLFCSPPFAVEERLRGIVLVEAEVPAFGSSDFFHRVHPRNPRNQ